MGGRGGIGAALLAGALLWACGGGSGTTDDGPGADARDVPGEVAVDVSPDLPADAPAEVPADVPADLPGEAVGDATPDAAPDALPDPGTDPGTPDVPPPDAPDDRPPACPAMAEAVVAGTVAAVDLKEASGLAASVRHPGVLWTHNDSGNAARIYALQADGTVVGRFDLDGVPPGDWEDIARGPLAGLEGDAIFVADVGDNVPDRPFVTVHVVAEPASPVADPPVGLPVRASMDLAYPTGPVDCESVFVDPVDGALYLVAKEVAEDGMSRVFRKAPPHVSTTGPVMLEEVARIPAILPTGASASADGSLLAVRTYFGGVLYRRAPGQSVVDALAGEPCELPPFPTEPQGEAIALAPDGSGFWSVSEWRSDIVQDLHWTGLGEGESL